MDNLPVPYCLHCLHESPFNAIELHGDPSLQRYSRVIARLLSCNRPCHRFWWSNKYKHADAYRTQGAITVWLCVWHNEAWLADGDGERSSCTTCKAPKRRTVTNHDRSACQLVFKNLAFINSTYSSENTLRSNVNVRFFPTG